MLIRMLKFFVALWAVMTMFTIVILWVIFTFLSSPIWQWGGLERLFFVFLSVVGAIVCALIASLICEAIEKEESDLRAIWHTDCDCGSCEDCDFNLQLLDRGLEARPKASD